MHPEPAVQPRQAQGIRSGGRTDFLSWPRIAMVSSLMPTLTSPRVAVLVELSSAHGRGLIRGIALYARRHTDWSLHLEESGPLRATPNWLNFWQGEGIIARLETPGITRAVLAKRVPVVNVSGYTSSRSAPQVDTDATAVDQWHVSQALRFIHGNATRDICVEDVVVQARASRRFLEKQFNAVVGRPIHAEILRVRLETAKRRLTTTTLPLKNVAARSGFRRADYLSSVFREKLGVSPSEFRSHSG